MRHGRYLKHLPPVIEIFYMHLRNPLIQFVFLQQRILETNKCNHQRSLRDAEDLPFLNVIDLVYSRVAVAIKVFLMADKQYEITAGADGKLGCTLHVLQEIRENR